MRQTFSCLKKLGELTSTKLLKNGKDASQCDLDLSRQKFYCKMNIIVKMNSLAVSKIRVQFYFNQFGS